MSGIVVCRRVLLLASQAAACPQPSAHSWGLPLYDCPVALNHCGTLPSVTQSGAKGLVWLGTPPQILRPDSSGLRMTSVPVAVLSDLSFSVPLSIMERGEVSFPSLEEKGLGVRSAPAPPCHSEEVPTPLGRPKNLMCLPSPIAFSIGFCLLRLTRFFAALRMTIIYLRLELSPTVAIGNADRDSAPPGNGLKKRKHYLRKSPWLHSPRARNQE